jgi:hypothetical protein
VGTRPSRRLDHPSIEREPCHCSLIVALSKPPPPVSYDFNVETMAILGRSPPWRLLDLSIFDLQQFDYWVLTICAAVNFFSHLFSTLDLCLYWGCHTLIFRFLHSPLVYYSFFHRHSFTWLNSSTFLKDWSCVVTLWVFVVTSSLIPWFLTSKS